MNKKKYLIIGLAAVVIIAILTVVIIGGRADPVTAIVATPEDYTEKIVAVGQLGLAQETKIVAEINGIVESVAVEEGQELNAGEVVIAIEGKDLEFRLAEAKALYLEAASQYENLTDFQFASARSDNDRLSSLKEQAKNDYENAMQLFNEGAISKSAMLEKNKTYESALSEWTTSKLRLDALSSGGSLREASKSRVDGSKALYENTLSDAAKYNIAVPWDSVLLKTYVNAGDYVQSGQILADIGSLGGYRVKSELDEKYFPYIKKGISALVFVGEDRYGEIEGIVDNITPRINPNTGTFSIEISLPEGFDYQASNLTVNLEIKLREVKQAIRIPKSYVLDATNNSSKESWVLVYEKGKAVKRTIRAETDLSSFLLVTDGLVEGDIVLDPESGLSEGDKVERYKEADAS